MVLLKQSLHNNAFLEDYLYWAISSFFFCLQKLIMLLVKRGQPFITALYYFIIRRPRWYETLRYQPQVQQARVYISPTLLSSMGCITCGRWVSSLYPACPPGNWNLSPPGRLSESQGLIHRPGTHTLFCKCHNFHSESLENCLVHCLSVPH